MEQRQGDSPAHKYGGDRIMGYAIGFIIVLVGACTLLITAIIEKDSRDKRIVEEEELARILPSYFTRDYWYEGKIYDPQSSELLLDMQYGQKEETHWTRIYRNNGEFFFITFRNYGSKLEFGVLKTPEEVFNMVKDDVRVRGKDHSELAQLFGLEYSEI